MILSGKSLTKAVKDCACKLSEMKLSCHFDANHTLCQNKQENKPIFACSCQGNLSLPLVKTALMVAAGVMLLSCCCHKKSQNQKTMS